MASSESPLLEIYHKISGIILTLTFAVNYILIYLTLFHAPNLFGTYRHFIVTFAVFGIAFSSFEFLIKPILYLNSSSVVIFSLGFSFADSHFIPSLMLAVFIGFHCSMLSLISIQFLYRYWSISSSVFLFERNRFAYWVLSVILGGLIWTVFTYEVISCDSLDRFRLKTELKRSYQVDSNILNCIRLEMRSSPSSSFRWPGFFFLLLFTIVLLIKLSTMLCCGLQMAVQVYKQSNFRSSRHHRQHSLFLKSIFVQLLAPVIILYIPTFIISFLPFIKTINGILIPVFTVYPVIDSIIVLNVVADYKIALKNAFSRIIWFVRSEEKQMDTPVNMSTLFSAL